MINYNAIVNIRWFINKDMIPLLISYRDLDTIWDQSFKFYFFIFIVSNG